MVVFVIDFSSAAAAVASGAESSTTSHPNPLNPVGATLRQYVWDQLHAGWEDPVVSSIVLTGGRSGNFSAGADLTEFVQFTAAALTSKSPAATGVTLVDVVQAVDGSPKPVVAAIAGVCLGGGLELALACHARVCNGVSQLGLPEVKVGLIPGAGGTQRLPRCVGLQLALQLIVTGKHMTAAEALQSKLVDAVVDDPAKLLETACQWAQWLEVMPTKHLQHERRVSQRRVPESPAIAHVLLHTARLAMPPPDRGGYTHHAACNAIEAAVKSATFEQGLQVEGEQFLKALMSDQGQAIRHAFFAVRAAQKRISSDPAVLSWAKQHPLLSQLGNKKKSFSSSAKSAAAASLLVHVAVLGAGTMGGGIAMVLLLAGYAVTVVDNSETALDKGRRTMQASLERQFGRNKKTRAGVSTQAQQELLLSRLTTTQNLHDLSSCMLVVEAVVENMRIKQDLFRQLDRIVPPECVMVSNTSTLDIDVMAKVMPMYRRRLFAGWHFFSPAHVMQLVEIIRGRDTALETLDLLQQLSKRIKKISVVVGNCDGFCGNRLLRSYSSESCLILVEDNDDDDDAPAVATIAQVDRALQATFGMALGPMQMSDLAGNDVSYNIRKERGWVRLPSANENGNVSALPPPNRPSRYTELWDDMVTVFGRLGQKTLKGWYNYDPTIGRGRTPLPSAEMEQLITAYRVKRNEPKASTSSSVKANHSLRRPPSDQDIIERLLFPLVNEGFKCLEEGIVRQPGDIDVVYLYGYGWPAWRGGPMYWADHAVGLPRLLQALEKYQERFPETDHFVPSPLLVRCVKMGVMVEEYYRKGLHKQQKQPPGATVSFAKL